MLRRLLPSSLFVLATTAYAVDVPPAAPPPDTAAPIEAVVLHPLFDVDFMCSEHYQGQVPYLGDALGSDCMVVGGIEGGGESGYTRPFRTDGKSNEDWYGWRTPVLSPLAGTVDRVNVNAVVNVPGQLGKPPASFILLSAADGTRVMVAHVDDILVEAGDTVQAGQPLGVVGNNGFARAPHIHVGAWRGETPLQVRFDLRAMGALRKKGDAGE
ncbi:M23 family metallopeptidase [Luteimonas vadosa]|uniref:M23ase beta-sheet core domain-containing protein n=1 Tax=Luteimonas vadosa TaxID=1165507 RepID=A0ABP9DRZ1_9GAMM